MFPIKRIFLVTSVLLITNHVALSQQSDTTFTVTSDGHVGIGTARPGQNLEISDVGGPVLRFNRPGIGFTDLYWDGNRLGITNGNLGIGTLDPIWRIHTVVDDAGSGYLSERFTETGNGPYFGFRRARGNQTSPQPLLDGDLLGQITWNGFHPNLGYLGVTGPSEAAIFAKVDGAVSANSMPTSLYFNTKDVNNEGNATRMVIKNNGNVGIGTTSPAAKLDVNGRISRKGQSFSEAGTTEHGSIITVPWGTRTDWNIFVSPRIMGAEEPGSEHDNALLMIQSFASVRSSTQWTITARYKYRVSRSLQGEWQNGQVNYLLVPK